MLDSRFVILAGIINFFGDLTYLIATIRGKVKPNKVTWGLWALAPFVAFTAEIQQGVGLVSLLTFSVSFVPIMIFIATFFNKKSFWKLTKFDFICAVFSVLGLILWYITKIGNLAILFSILADCFAGIPTVIKSWKSPETEDYKFALFAVIAAIITLLTIKTWTFAYYGYPLYLIVICGILFILIKFRLGKILGQKNDRTYT